MENILNYVHLRSDVSFQYRAFNEVDALILSELSYVDFDHILGKEPMCLASACKQYLERYTTEQIREKFIFCRMLPDFIRSMVTMERYKNVQIRDYESQFDEEKELQFAAMTFVLPDGSLFIAYRGTDGTITGWKENLQMTYRSHLPCQKLAKEYFKKQIDSIQEQSYFFGLRKKKVYPKIYLGGHSKGGNLAMYAALENEDDASLISEVFAFDAPGFRRDIWEGLKTVEALHKITNYKPKDSIIGCVLEHREQACILEASDSGLVQHDAFNWAIGPQGFVKAASLTKQSKEALAYVNRILMSKSDEDKKNYIDLIFSLTDKLDIRSIADLTEIGLKQGLSGVYEVTQMAQEERKFLFEVIYFLRMETYTMLKQMKEK